MRLRDLSRSELVAVVGGVMLAVGVFTPWYSLGPNDHIHNYRGTASGTMVSGWQASKVLGILLLLGAVAPFILTYIIARGRSLSWPRGEMTAVVAVIALGLVGYRVFISRPGSTTSETSIAWGGILAFAGAIVMLLGSATRASATERPRKPPGVL